MCGFIGVFGGQSKRTLHRIALAEGLSRMRARGPDAHGIHEAPPVILGHCRLMVMDLNGGQQPLRHPESGCVLVFNGEIYGFHELRRQLETRGHRFSSRSDTEVLLHAYLEWNDQCLDHIRGMFAFALYDPRRHRILLARDHTGIKPLFYACRDRTLLFASSVCAIRAFPEIDTTPDLAAVSHYLSTTRTCLGHRTLLQGVQTLLPGESLSMTETASEPVRRRYWEIPILAAADKPDPGLVPASGRVRDMIEQSVNEQLLSDVPLGGFLSGGLDSCILTSVAARRSPGQFETYGTGYQRPGYEEWDYMRMAARHCGVPCHEVVGIPADYPATWKHLVRFKGLPLSTPNEVPIYHLATALRKRCVVALTGEGADEIFGGYTLPCFSAFDYDRASQLDPPVTNRPLTPLEQSLRRLYGRTRFACRPDHFFCMNTWMPFSLKAQLLSPDTWQALDQDAALFAEYETLFNRLDRCSTFDAYLHLHARLNLENLLFRVDSSTMAASVEARVPFTDHRLVEYLFTLPDHYKMDWISETHRIRAADLNVQEICDVPCIESKRILRTAFEADLPGAIRNRPKMSFPVPFFEWIEHSLPESMMSILEDSGFGQGLFQPAAIRRLLRTTSLRQSAFALWPILNICLWMHTGRDQQHPPVTQPE